MASISVICHPNDGRFIGGAKVSLDSAWDWGQCLAAFQKACGGKSLSCTIDRACRLDSPPPTFTRTWWFGHRPNVRQVTTSVRGVKQFSSAAQYPSPMTNQFQNGQNFQPQQGMFCCSSSAWLVWYEYVLARVNILFGSFMQSGYEVRKLNDLIKDEDVCISLDGSDFVRLGKSSFRTWLTRGALVCVSCWLTNRHLQRAVQRAPVVVQWTWTTISLNCGKELSIFICCQSSHFHSCIGLIAFCCTFLLQKNPMMLLDFFTVGVEV